MDLLIKWFVKPLFIAFGVCLVILLIFGEAVYNNHIGDEYVLSLIWTYLYLGCKSFWLWFKRVFLKE